VPSADRQCREVRGGLVRAGLERVDAFSAAVVTLAAGPSSLRVRQRRLHPGGAGLTGGLGGRGRPARSRRGERARLAIEELTGGCALARQVDHCYQPALEAARGHLAAASQGVGMRPPSGEILR